MAEDEINEATVFELIKQVVNYKNSQLHLDVNKKRNKNALKRNVKVYPDSTDSLMVSYNEQIMHMIGLMRQLEGKLMTCNNRYSRFDKTFDKFFHEFVSIVFTLLKEFKVAVELKEVFPDINPKKLFNEFVDTRAICCRLVTMLQANKLDLNLIKAEVKQWADKYDAKIDAQYWRKFDIDRIDFGKNFAEQPNSDEE